MTMDASTRTIAILFLGFLLIATISLSSSYGNLDPVVCVEAEKRALLSFKQGLEDPSNRLSSWDIVEDDCCKWAGVVCNNLTGHVRELHLQSPYDHYPIYPTQFEYDAYEKSKLGGEVNPSLLNLKHLNYLDLSLNDFGGIPIPGFLGSVASLRHLNLSEARFAGTVPHQLGNLSSLRFLSLKGTGVGELEVENLHWLSGLSTLEHLDLSLVNLTKAHNWLQVINMLPSLVVLNLFSCQIGGPISDGFWNLTSLKVLDFSDNYLKFSSLPNLLSSVSGLVSLDLGMNGFEGPIPILLQNMTSLRDLDLSGNFFNSSIPNWLYSFRNLELLSLGSNRLQGTISSSIENLTSVITLDLSGNELDGRIPRAVGNLCNLRDLSLSFNRIVGDMTELSKTLSRCISYALESLNLQMNQFSGHLSDQLGQFKSLQYLDLRGNSISGPIPVSLGRCSCLVGLILAGNQLNGTLPESLGHISKLRLLDISDNLLVGVVSEVHFANLTSLRRLYAYGNQLVFKVSPDWIPPFQLEAIDLKSCHLGPQFPMWIRSQKGFRDLDLSSTGISDSIPSWFWNVSSNFEYLNLSHNQIHGKLPNILKLDVTFSMIYLSSNHFSGPLPRLSSNVTELDLSNNAFSGDIFHFLCDRKDEPNQMKILHLGGNLLSGEIPDCWMHWPSLRVMNLGNNHLRGNIPSSMGYLLGLKSLHLRNNSLSGEVPLSLQNCTELVMIDLGWNQFVGSMPTWLGRSLSNLMILSLRSNNFYGKIPSELCHLTSLQILDLANNSFLGSMPPCFKNFTALAVKQNSSNPIIYSINMGGFIEDAIVVTKGRELQYDTILQLVTGIDLSDNNISGEIPDELTSLLGLQSLNLSGNHFTGVIPKEIGGMELLESLDFSRNKLSGEIPPSMSALTFLSHLNVSYNNLSGKIPLSTQLQSLDASSFIGNRLCGPPLTENCSINGATPGIQNGGDKEGAKSEVDWLFYLTVILGFIVGFWCICGPLLYNKSWRSAYFLFLDETWNRISNCLSKY